MNIKTLALAGALALSSCGGGEKKPEEFNPSNAVVFSPLTSSVSDGYKSGTASIICSKIPLGDKFIHSGISEPRLCDEVNISIMNETIDQTKVHIVESLGLKRVSDGQDPCSISYMNGNTNAGLGPIITNVSCGGFTTEPDETKKDQ